MKPALVAASLVLTVVLLATLAARPQLAPPALEQFIVRHLHSEARKAPAPAAAAKKSAARPPPAWGALQSDDPATLIARLRAAGFPASLIRAVVTAEVGERYDSQIRRLQEPDPNIPFWQQPASFFMSGDKRLQEMSRLYRERSRVLRDLFKDDFFASTETTAAQRRQFGDLPLSKIDALQRIEDDYADMIAAVRTESQGILLPEDREKLALLNREKKADLASVLGAQELENYELRASQTATMMRTRLAAFEPTESEFRALYQAQLKLNEKFQGGFESVDYRERQSIQNEYYDQLRATLGDARYADFVRETSSDFQQLSRLAQRDNLPSETTLRAYNLRHTISAESNQIYDNATLSNEAKREALKALATTARTQMLSTLGASAGPEYVRISNQWLQMLERGAAVSFNRPSTFMVVTDQGTMSMSGIGADYRFVPSTPQPKK